MTIGKLILNEFINDETEITISIILIALGGEKTVANGKWYEDRILIWKEETIVALDIDFINNTVNILI